MPVKKNWIVLIGLLFINTLSFAQNYVNVTFRHYPTSPGVVRAFVPGTFNNWGPNSNGRINVNAPSLMTYVDSLGYYVKTIRLRVGDSHNYKFHEHYNGSGSDWAWYTDPLNPLINYSDNNNSIINIGKAMIFQLLPRKSTVVKGVQPEIIAGIFTAEDDSILMDQSAVYLNDSLVTTFEGNIVPGLSILNYSIPELENGNYEVVINVLTQNGETLSDTTNFYIENLSPVEEELPEGIVDGINYIDESTVTLSLYAPHKDFVYLIGGFNNWEIDPNYYMKRTPDSSRYWLTITGLESQTEYVFQYFVDGEIRIADPYTDKTSDPAFDQEIINEGTYPNLKPYPTGKTTEIASVLQTAQEPFQWDIPYFQRPDPQDLVIYELLIRDFLAEHDYKTLTDTLGYFEKLGVNAIELMPINEFEGNQSWGYNPAFYFAPDKYYGPKNDLKKFIDEAHKRGIAVIIDMVLNHAYGQCPLVRLYAGDMANNPCFNQQAPHTDYSWGYDFNHECQPTKDFVDRVLSYWLNEYHVDGFRFDFTRGFTNKRGSSGARDGSRIAILKRIYDHIRSVDSTAYVILEHLIDDNNEMKELAAYGMMLWGNMSHDYQEAAMGYQSSFSWGSYQTRGWNVPHLVTYMESHDEERLMYKNLQWGNTRFDYKITDLNTALDRIKLVSAFFFTIPGPKMIWQFGELGYDYSIDYNGRLGNKPIRWDYFREIPRLSLYKTMQALIDLKKHHDAFRTTNYSLNVAMTGKKIHLNHETMNVTIIGNFGVELLSVTPNFQHTGEWYNYFLGDTIVVANTQSSIVLAPGEFRIYTDVKLDEPDIIIGIEDRSLTRELRFHLAQNHPNPFNPQTRIKYELAKTSDVDLNIYNVIGQKIKTLANETQTPGNHQVIWNCLTDDGLHAPNGVYLYRLRAGDFIQTRKMILLN